MASGYILGQNEVSVVVLIYLIERILSLQIENKKFGGKDFKHYIESWKPYGLAYEHRLNYKTCVFTIFLFTEPQFLNAWRLDFATWHVIWLEEVDVYSFYLWLDVNFARLSHYFLVCIFIAQQDFNRCALSTNSLNNLSSVTIRFKRIWKMLGTFTDWLAFYWEKGAVVVVIVW